MKHGTISGYQYHKCRCTDCRNAKRKYEKKLKLKKLEGIPELIGPKPIQHGTHNAYTNRKCRCEICSAFMRGYQFGYKTRSLNEINEAKATVKLSDEELIQAPQEKQRKCGTSEAYSFGCTCDLCLTKGRNEYLAEITA